MCACDPNERLSAPSICFVWVFVCRKLFPQLGVLELDHRCLHSLYVVLVCHQYDVCKKYVGGVYISGYGGLSESGLCVFR